MVKIKDYHEIFFMPWAGLKEDLQIGPVLFTPWAKAITKIKSSEILDYLRKYFVCYVDYQSNPVDSMVLCIYKDNYKFRILNNKEYVLLKNTVNMLVFSIIAPTTKNAVCGNNRSMGTASADVFQLEVKRFRPGDKYLSVRAGSALHCWEIGEVKFSKPWSTGGFCQMANKELVDGFSKTFDKRFPIDVRERISRSLEWFRLSHIEVDNVSSLSKIVMTATAFEILLQVPRLKKKEWIAKTLDGRIAISGFIKMTKKIGKNKIRFSKLGWWAWDFYNLRNSIVHGDTIDLRLTRYRVRDKSWVSHYIVADLVFWEYVKRELFEHNCIGDNVYSSAKEWDKAFPRSKKSAVHFLVPWFLGFNDVHKALGWIRKKI